jgi:acyl carrier protein
VSETEASKSTGLLARVQRILPGRRKERQPRVQRSEQEIQGWIVQRVAETLAIDTQGVDPTLPFADYGFDSRTAVRLSGELEEQLGLELSPTLVWDYPTIASMASFLAAECAAKAADRGDE